MGSGARDRLKATVKLTARSPGRTLHPLKPFLLLLCACAPVITQLPADVVADSHSPARGVELCVIVQEHFARPQIAGVAEFSSVPWQYAIASIVVKHPSGLTIIDPAFGQTIAAELARAGPTFSVIAGTADTKTPLVDLLRLAHIDPNDIHTALVTHTHWDHVGALRDLPNARVLINKTELEATRHSSHFLEDGVITPHLKSVKDRIFTFTYPGPPRDGFAASFDVFGDGSIIAVPLPGHTVGSTGYWVTDTAGHHWLFIGDASWTVRGIEKPAHKLVPIDADTEELSKSLALLHTLFANRTDVTVVPAHDESALGLLPNCSQH